METPITRNNENNRSESLAKLLPALLKAKAKFPKITKNAINKYYNSKYTTLDNIINAVTKPLADNDMLVTHTTVYGEMGSILATTLWHTSGEWLRVHVPLCIEKGGPQSAGSALNYATRQSYVALLSLPLEDDDDGEAGEGRNGKAIKKARPRAKAAPKPVENTEKTTAKAESEYTKGCETLYFRATGLDEVLSVVDKIAANREKAPSTEAYRFGMNMVHDVFSKTSFSAGEWKTIDALIDKSGGGMVESTIEQQAKQVF